MATSLVDIERITITKINLFFMPFIKSAQNNASPINIYFEDTGIGKPVLFIHGWPLSGAMWEYQLTQLPQQGMRCITYDRRGFGKSDRPFAGYDYSTLATDLKALMDELDLNDVTLVGFSMGGGEIAKYFSMFGGDRVSKVVLVSSVIPFMLQTETNPNGVPQQEFDKMTKRMIDDRPAFMQSFNQDFFGVTITHDPVSDAFLANSFTSVMDASPIATLRCAESFSNTDFRQDILKINVPTLIIHGDKDKTVPVKATSEEAAKLIYGSKLVIYEDAPHGLWYTHKEQLNQDLIDFI